MKVNIVIEVCVPIAVKLLVEVPDDFGQEDDADPDGLPYDLSQASEIVGAEMPHVNSLTPRLITESMDDDAHTLFEKLLVEAWTKAKEASR